MALAAFEELWLDAPPAERDASRGSELALSGRSQDALPLDTLTEQLRVSAGMPTTKRYRAAATGCTESAG